MKKNPKENRKKEIAVCEEWEDFLIRMLQNIWRLHNRKLSYGTRMEKCKKIYLQNEYDLKKIQVVKYSFLSDLEMNKLLSRLKCIYKHIFVFKYYMYIHTYIHIHTYNTYILIYMYILYKCFFIFISLIQGWIQVFSLGSNCFLQNT